MAEGYFKSEDAGKTWKHVGLKDAGQIGAIRVHPANPDLVYVAALGHLFGPNAERGVFRSKDGGATWDKVLYVSEKAGAVDLSMDARNPRILYAGIWPVVRLPWTLVSGGEGGGLHKSTDGGDTWTKLANGLPKGTTGRIGVSVSPANPNRVWAIIDADIGKKGVFRTDDAGATWTTWSLPGQYADPVRIARTSRYAYVAGYAGEVWRFDLSLPGDIDADGDVDVDDQALFVTVLLKTDLDPGHVQRADVNGDGSADAPGPVATGTPASSIMT